MGSFLHVGLVTVVKTNCDIIEDVKHIKQEIIDTIMPLDDFDITKDTDGDYNFVLQDNYYGQKLINFMKEQFVVSDRISSDSLNALANIKSFSDLEATIENEDLWPFHLQTFGTYRCNSLNQKTINISLEALVFAQDGKIILEQGEWIFEYFEHNIRLQKNPLAKYVKIYIS